jgi:hypothetical protein
MFKKLGFKVKSHDFRHAKLTNLASFLKPHQVRDYAGHSSISVTDVYLHSNQEDVLKIVADAQRDLSEAEEKVVPQKRVAKATKKFALKAQKEALEKNDENESNFALHSLEPPGAHNRHIRRSKRTKNTV